jgi:hypothetical protein
MQELGGQFISCVSSRRPGKGKSPAGRVSTASRQEHHQTRLGMGIHGEPRLTRACTQTSDHVFLYANGRNGQGWRTLEWDSFSHQSWSRLGTLS